MSTYSPIASQTTTSSVSSITFASIPQNYTDLVIVMNTVATASIGVNLTFNGDTAGNYAWMQMWGPNGYAVNSENQANRSFIDQQSSGTTYGHVCITNVNSYSNTNVSKMVIQQSKDNVNNRVYMQTAPWRSTAAITSLTLSASGGNIAAGSIFNLYGIQASGKYATGGNIIVSDGTYWYHAFTSSGVFTPNKALTCDYLVVAGGGGGSTRWAGGGGAGGLRYASAQSLTTTGYTITVGAGGAFNTSGANSSIIGDAISFTSTGGGKGGGDSSRGDPTSGGSGGGAYTAQTPGSGNTPSTSPSQGNSGGTGLTQAGWATGGGGGGAGGVGGNSSSSSGGNGGIGVNTYSSWASATSTGAGGYYAGGGGGAGDNRDGSQNAGAGGSGGGGAGSVSGDATAGTANTGGGGGGAGNSSATAGGAGGSGIVIVRYAV